MGRAAQVKPPPLELHLIVGDEREPSRHDGHGVREHERAQHALPLVERHQRLRVELERALVRRNLQADVVLHLHEAQRLGGWQLDRAEDEGRRELLERELAIGEERDLELLPLLLLLRVGHVHVRALPAHHDDRLAQDGQAQGRRRRGDDGALHVLHVVRRLRVDRDDRVPHLQRAILVCGAAEHDGAHGRRALVLVELESQRASRLVTYNRHFEDLVIRGRSRSEGHLVVVVVVVVVVLVVLVDIGVAPVVILLARLLLLDEARRDARDDALRHPKLLHLRQHGLCAVALDSRRNALPDVGLGHQSTGQDALKARSSVGTLLRRTERRRLARQLLLLEPCRLRRLLRLQLRRLGLLLADRVAHGRALGCFRLLALDLLPAQLLLLALNLLLLALSLCLLAQALGLHLALHLDANLDQGEEAPADDACAMDALDAPRGLANALVLA
mmetsp:Transcript_5100/g.13427  ORF Transcript_5100/g.13427 Transcript_5100/m.13427 type:complete len:446 (-) Transcript_5100:640-1977(-)